MASYITIDGLRSALSKFLSNILGYLPIKGYTEDSKSKVDTLEVQNIGESALGKYNSCNSNTIFTVGNGNEAKRSNALEVHHDGSIYIQKDGESVKLQDMSVENIPVEEVQKLN